MIDLRDLMIRVRGASNYEIWEHNGEGPAPGMPAQWNLREPQFTNLEAARREVERLTGSEKCPRIER